MKTTCINIPPSRFHYDFPQKKEEILFFDIETTGLSPKTSSIYLIGVLFYDGKEDCFTVLQWFAEKNSDEKEVLSSFLAFLESYGYLYHFNGRTFDIPYVLEKSSRHALLLSDHVKKILTDDSGTYSIDLFIKIRKLKHFLSLKKCSQKALEEYLGIFREDTFSGGELIHVYSEYAQMRLLAPEKADALEKVLLLHNFEDVEMMLSVCSLLQYEILFSESSPVFEEKALEHLKISFVPQSEAKAEQNNTSIEISPEKESYGFLTLFLPSAFIYPKKITKECCYPENEKKPPQDAAQNPPKKDDLPPARLQVKEKELLFSFPVIKTSLKYFFEDYKNYYYLPAEDMAIHKSISSFTDSTHRKKATKATCYIKKEGSFLPSLMPQKKKAQKNTALFFKDYGDKTAYYEFPKDHENNTSFWKHFLKEQISCFNRVGG